MCSDISPDLRWLKYVLSKLSLRPVQTRCLCTVLGNGHQSEHRFLLVPEQTFEHRARARALARAPFPGTGTCLNTLSSVPALFPMLPCDAVTIMAAGAKWTKEEFIALIELGCQNKRLF